MQTIIIYADQGVDGGALKQTIRSLQQEVHPDKYILKRLDAKAILNQPWEQETRLLIIPGGRDVFYHASLDGAGTDRIRRFVENGGSYLGLCAGAYFACQSIEFEKGGVLEAYGSRSLRFFPGIAKGSAYGPNKYSYENAKGVEAAKISWDAGKCHAYFNGGCLFEAEDHYPWVRTLSHYLDLPGHPPAVLEIEIGKGKAILSGVHLEYNPRLLNRDDPYLSKLLPTLEAAEQDRRRIFRSLLTKLGISLETFPEFL
jgi:biotin--protein ligase